MQRSRAYLYTRAVVRASVFLVSFGLFAVVTAIPIHHWLFR